MQAGPRGAVRAIAVLLLVTACASPSVPAAVTTSAGSPPTTGAAMPGRSASTGPPVAAPAASPGAVVPTPIEVRGQTVQYHGEQSVAGAPSVAMTMEDFSFTPTVLVGTTGQRLQVNLTNTGKVEHTFTIPGQADVVLSPGARGSVTVRFPSSGQVPFVCTYHVGAGMAGVLAVG